MSEAPDSENVDSTEATESLATMAVVSNYKVLGQFTDYQGAGVLGRNDAGSGTPIGVQGAVPNSSSGYGLATPDDMRLAGILDTDETDFRVQAGTTSTKEGQNVILGHASNHVADAVVGATIGGGGWDDGAVAFTNEVYDNYNTIAGGQRNVTGSPNDDDPTTSEYATIGGGYNNEAAGEASTVAGGDKNQASGYAATIAGGSNNSIHSMATEATIGGGGSNSAERGRATVAGGGGNAARGEKSTIGGGFGNEATLTAATVGGGDSNRAYAQYATVGGGQNNEGSGKNATVSGGDSNLAFGEWSVVGGGQYNDVMASHATIAGGGSTDGTDATGNAVYDDYGTVGGGGNNQAGMDDSTSNAIYAVVGGGQDNTASAARTTVGGGEANTASAQHATVSGGTSNSVTAAKGTVAGGEKNQVQETQAVVVGGVENIASGTQSVVAGGFDNEIKSGALQAAVGGGYFNIADGDRATIPGGRGNKATGKVSFAAGYRAQAVDDGAFVWADDQGATNFSSSGQVGTSDPTGANTFSARAYGGVRFATGSSKVTYISSGSTGWSTSSSRAVKTNVSPFEPDAALSGVEEMDVCTWEYEDEDGEGAGVTHVGPMAEDFHEAFEADLGDSDEHINSINADGLAFAAIQGLSERLERKEERIDELEAENEQLRERLEEIEAHVGLDNGT
ncbi:tail fiber domain-containing protein [Halapricum salinum]|uniref:Peptidase S74 domain-containing protein n=1 Tax=Halapricum salinum TaxID=1457250 RepID=A0A4D6HBG5_9EURY|nr:tail fiber domain-containing protein [Halapricum salinum]QCC50851.1 hypothetical protein DV733_06150 [Halapricum salinum]